MIYVDSNPELDDDIFVIKKQLTLDELAQQDKSSSEGTSNNQLFGGDFCSNLKKRFGK